MRRPWTRRVAIAETVPTGAARLYEAEPEAFPQIIEVGRLGTRIQAMSTSAEAHVVVGYVPWECLGGNVVYAPVYSATEAKSGVADMQMTRALPREAATVFSAAVSVGALIAGITAGAAFLLVVGVSFGLLAALALTVWRK